MSSKTNTRLLLIIFSLIVVSGFSYSVLKAEDLKEKQTLLKNISVENQDYSKYRHSMIEDMEAENEKHRREMALAKEQYLDILNKQQAAINQHTKQVAVVSKRLVAVEETPTKKKKSNSIASADSNSNNSNSSSSNSNSSSGSSSSSSSGSSSSGNTSSGSGSSSGSTSSKPTPVPTPKANPTPKAVPSPTPTVKPKPTKSTTSS